MTRWSDELQAWRSMRVLATWLGLTILIIGFSLLNIFEPNFRMIPKIGFVVFSPPILGLVGLFFLFISLAHFSGRPVYAGIGTLLIAVAVISIHVGCPAVACSGPERLRIFLTWTWFGPSISGSMAPPPCTYTCPYSIHTIPAVLGYWFIGKSMKPMSEYSQRDRGGKSVNA